MTRAIFALLCVTLAQSCGAAEPFCDTAKVHPIDAQLERELEKSGGVTVTIRDAQGKAYELWDKELNKSYKDLQSLLKPKDQELLKQSQRAWIAYRDAQAKLWWAEGLYGSGGTLGPVVVSDLGRAMLRQRVCELVKYKNIAENGGF